MYIIRTWLRWLAGFGIVVIVERAALAPTLAVFLTGLVFLVLTVLTYGDWSSVRQVAHCTCYAPVSTWRPRPGRCWS
jgi:hypothetical protein